MCIQIRCKIYLFLNNQPDATFIQVYSVIKLYMFRASSLPIIRSFLLYIRHWYVSCRFLMTASEQSQETVIKHLYETYQCRMHSRKLLMMGREDARNIQSFITEQIWIIGASDWLFKKKYVTMYGSMNVKCVKSTVISVDCSLLLNQSRQIINTQCHFDIIN
jgi:hypothetical protein